MKKLLYVLLFALVCGTVVSCNEKPIHYRFVQVNPDGTEKVENIDAKNDTDALQKYMSRMEKIIIAAVVKGEEPDIDAMYVISPSGDTLNTNKELLEAVSMDLPKVKDPAPETPEAADSPAA